MPIPFVGGSYELKRKKADTQRSVNLMPTPVESGGGKAGMYLAPVPGLVVFSERATLYLYLASPPYPIISTDSLDIGHSFDGGKFLSVLTEESLDVSHAFDEGVLTTTLLTYGDWPDEGLDISHDLDSGVLTTVLLTYSDWPDEGMDISHSLDSGVLTIVLLTYSDWPDEAIDFSHALDSGTLT